MDETLYGRQLLKSDIPKSLRHVVDNDKQIKKVAGMSIDGQFVVCQRCGHENHRSQCQTSTGYYCVCCINMGKVKSDAFLYRIPRKLKQAKRERCCEWRGDLTKIQQRVANDLLTAYDNQTNHFVHAVTGAGKTEMLFPLIEKALTDGKIIGIATPRIDVCLELFPRLQAAFPSIKSNLLYGKSKQEFDGASLVICTTHQLMRFFHYFDILVIDEADAFPYVNSAELQYATKNALVKQGMMVFLTATSNKNLENYQNTTRSVVSRRFHGRDLPVPNTFYCPKLSTQLRKGTLPKKLIQTIDKQTHPLIVFFPDISLMLDSYNVLKKRWPDKQMGVVYASSKTREETVEKMRRGDLDILLSTTILERGVTFHCISVMVVCADHRVFNRATLIQIAGRVGRSRDSAVGKVLFLHEGKTTAIKQAIKEIKQMNRRSPL